MATGQVKQEVTEAIRRRRDPLSADELELIYTEFPNIVRENYIETDRYHIYLDGVRVSPRHKKAGWARKGDALNAIMEVFDHPVFRNLIADRRGINVNNHQNYWSLHFATGEYEEVEYWYKKDIVNKKLREEVIERLMKEGRLIIRLG